MYEKLIDVLGIQISHGGTDDAICRILPHWFLAAVGSVLAVVPWLPWITSLLPPHHAHRHDAGGRRAGAGRLAGAIGFPVWYTVRWDSESNAEPFLDPWYFRIDAGLWGCRGMAGDMRFGVDDTKC